MLLNPEKTLEIEYCEVHDQAHMIPIHDIFSDQTLPDNLATFNIPG